jgi:hypothetical protein
MSEAQSAKGSAAAVLRRRRLLFDKPPKTTGDAPPVVFQFLWPATPDGLAIHLRSRFGASVKLRKFPLVAPTPTLFGPGSGRIALQGPPLFIFPSA